MKLATVTFVLCAIFCASLAHAQGVAYSGSPVINGEGQPLAGVSVAISTVNPCGTSPTYTYCGGLPQGTYTGATPPGSAATLYTDVTAGTTRANPISTDPFGNWTAYLASGGTYWATVYSPYVVAQVSVFSVGSNSGLFCALTGGSGCVMTGAMEFGDANVAMGLSGLNFVIDNGLSGGGFSFANAAGNGIDVDPTGIYLATNAARGLPVYANNAAALAGGLTLGELYQTGSNPDQVAIVDTVSAAKPVRTCQTGLGDGYNAIPSATYPQFFCVNDSTVNRTITAIHCYTDNNGTSALSAANNAATALLTGAITCTDVKGTWGAAGTLSSAITLVPGDAVTFSFAADGTSTQTTWVVSFTQ